MGGVMKKDCYGCFVDVKMLLIFLFNYGIHAWSYIDDEPIELLNAMQFEDEMEDEMEGGD